MSRLGKSTMYIIGFGGFSYALMKVLDAKGRTLNEEVSRKYGRDSGSVKTTMDVLQAAAESEKPLYRMTKEELEELGRKRKSKPPEK